MVFVFRLLFNIVANKEYNGESDYKVCVRVCVRWRHSVGLV